MKIKYLDYVHPEEGDLFVYDKSGRILDSFTDYRKLNIFKRMRCKKSHALEGILEIAKKDKSKGPKRIFIFSDRPGEATRKRTPRFSSIQEYREFFIKLPFNRTLVVSENVDQIYYEEFNLLLDRNEPITGFAYIFDYNVLYGGVRLKEDVVYHDNIKGRNTSVSLAFCEDMNAIYPTGDMLVCYVDHYGLEVASAEMVEVVENNDEN